MKKLVFVGCGGIAEYHLGNMLGYKADFLDKHGIELVGFCDIIPERAQAFVDKVGSGKAYTDYRTMYDEIQPDIAFICIPPYCHGELDLETFRRGIHAYVEKPVALDLDLAGEILDVIRRNNVITAVGFQCRYGRVSDLARQFCAEHRVAFVDMTRMGGIPGTFWWQKKELSGGQIVEQTIHNFDIVRYALGDPIEVCTFGTRGFVGNVPDYDTEDLTTTIVRFENGAGHSPPAAMRKARMLRKQDRFLGQDCRLTITCWTRWCCMTAVRRRKEPLWSRAMGACAAPTSVVTKGGDTAPSRADLPKGRLRAILPNSLPVFRWYQIPAFRWPATSQWPRAVSSVRTF